MISLLFESNEYVPATAWFVVDVTELPSLIQQSVYFLRIAGLMDFLDVLQIIFQFKAPPG